MNFARGEVRRSGQPLDITAIEFRLLTTFIRQRGGLPREQLLDHVWGRGSAPTDRVVDSHVMNLRRRSRRSRTRPSSSSSLRGMGYRFDG